MMSWYHRILCQLILGEYRWIYLNVSRRNNLEGKQYHFSPRQFKLQAERNEWEMKNKTYLEGVIGQRWRGGKVWLIEEAKEG